jgi:lipopolysaccharide transport system ATP-binding protein
MSDTILKVDNISKQYRLGSVGTGTVGHDLNRWWHNVRGKEDPYLKIGAVNDRSAEASSDYVWALQNINFEVKRGEVLGIIGKNGAGKSTLLKILSRVTSPTTGKIQTRGKIASLLEVGTGMHPELTGRENIYLNGAILGMTKVEIKDKIDAIVEFSGCQMYIDTPVKRYSSGMRVRLGFAVAAFLEPEIMVVDEVLAVGDAEFQKKAIGKMKDISEGGGKTVLFVSHNMASIQVLCTRLVVLDNGQVLFDGNVEEGIQEYLLKNNDREIEINNSDLTTVEKRVGSGEVLFSRVEFYSYFKNGQKTDSLLTGNKFQIDIFFKKIVPDVLLGMVMSIGFYNMDGSFMFACRSDSVGFQMRIDNDLSKVSIVIDKLPLIEGEYSYTLISYQSGNIVDWIKNAGVVRIEEGDFYGYGKMPAKLLKGVLIEYNYEYGEITN